MSTRLDRLFLLLDNGSTPLIRKSAAEQLGEVQKLHPYELNNLLSKVHVYLRSSSWETRIAAGQAVEAISKNVPQWEPRGAPKSEVGSSAVQDAGKILFSQFDVNKVLAFGASLLGSEGVQYDSVQSFIGVDDKEHLAQQRQLLNKRLGLDIAGNLGLDSNNLFNDEDLHIEHSSNGQTSSQPMYNQPVADLVKQQLMDVTRGLSAREKNKAKRKAKHLAKQISKDGSSECVSQEFDPPAKKTKQEVSEENGKNNVETGDNTLNLDEMEEWPFESFCEVLMNDLFNSSWEIRHGAATGLREIIKQHGRGASKSCDTPADQMSAVNQIWLSDLALRLLCVLVLDRFGDFVSDEVVAPVRETCAQDLGVLLKFLDVDGVNGVTSVLLQLLSQQQWEVRHGGLLGLKYLLAVREDLRDVLLPTVLPGIFQGLQDSDDDVRAVAAAALVPVSDKLVTLLPNQTPIIINCLWETLLDLDDLTASTNSIMSLLSKLLSNPSSMSSSMSQSLTELTPRLWPFLRHNITSVRKATLETLYTLLNIFDPQTKKCFWITSILPDTLRHIYQRVLLENNGTLIELTYKVWTLLLERSPLDYLIAASMPWLGVWLCLLMQPSRTPFEPTYLIEAKHKIRDSMSSTKRSNVIDSSLDCNKDNREYIGGIESLNKSLPDRDYSVTRARISGARLLGMLSGYITQHVSNYPPEAEKPVDSLTKLFTFHLNTKSALQRYVIGQVLYHWSLLSKDCLCSDEVKSKLLQCLNEAIYFDEIALAFTRMQSDCRDFIASIKQQGIEMDSLFPPTSILSLDQASQLTSTVFDNIKAQLKPRMLQTLDDRRQQLQISVTQTTIEQQTYTIRVLNSLAMAAVVLNVYPEKLNPVIRPLMDCIKKEENETIQIEASKCLARLFEYVLDKTPNPTSKIIKNLTTYICCDTSSTPLINQPVTSKITDSLSHEVSCDNINGIITLCNLQKVSEKGRKWVRRSTSVKVEVDNVPTDLLQDDSEHQELLKIQKRGGERALCTICQHFNADLQKKLPDLWNSCIDKLSLVTHDSINNSDEVSSQDLVNSLQVLQVVSPSFHSSILSQVTDKLPQLCICLQHRYAAVRHMASRCIGVLCQLQLHSTMQFVIENIIPMLGNTDNDIQRQGSIEAIANMIEILGMNVLPYIVLLVVPVLGCMCDQNEPVRLMATHGFAQMIRLLPLEAGIPDPPEMKGDLANRRDKERKFLEQLLDGSKSEDYNITVDIKAELRKYQQDGVNWLGFLNKYKLHGILCDDMGLGKTLQSICILATDHYERQKRYQKENTPDCCPLPSLVVCPPTLVGHWVYEINKFVDTDLLNPLMYAGPPSERIRLQKKFKKHNLIVASYDVVRNDIEFFTTFRWNYCILDEGHIIRNGKTKLSKAVKQLLCNHRLILSGTPIQNNVLDLWSLFDFLMPGFLGTEKQFQARYGKPILQSRDGKSTTKEQEAGALAMEALHRQVLPFILRRLKEDVLQDLPPKIIQDYYCDLSPLQVELYEDFARSQVKNDIEDDVVTEDSSGKKSQGSTHVFQALQYLRKVCNHPSLVLTTSHPKYDMIMSRLKHDKSSIHDIQHAPKLTALKQLLNDCGIGVGSSNTSGTSNILGTDVPVVNQHRVLLFCQLKSMLNIVEQDLIKREMPSVTYLRLDGGVPATSRHDIVQRFNNDPSIDMLLLTTHVGGLGLNLTGADTVIFVEHDWNPMKDLQAMDRAHRIGQKKVVNVYRLVTRGTLEEKIMGLQKFKLNIANTVISQDNSNLQSMATDQLLHLFTLDDMKKGQSSVPSTSSDKPVKKESMKTILQSLEGLWDEPQYDTEYDLNNFMQSLNK